MSRPSLEVRRPAISLAGAAGFAALPRLIETLVGSGAQTELAVCSTSLQSQTFHKFGDPHVQGIRDDLQRLKGHVAFPTLNLTNVRAVQSRSVGEDVLRPAVLFSQ